MWFHARRIMTFCVQNTKMQENTPSRKRSHIPPGENENNLQKYIEKGYVIVPRRVSYTSSSLRILTPPRETPDPPNVTPPFFWPQKRCS